MSRPQTCPFFSARRDQLREVIAQGRLAAGEGHMRDASQPGLVQNAAPFVRGQLAVHAFDRRVFGLCASGKTVGEGAVEPEWSGEVSRVGRDPLKIQVSDGVQVGCGQKRVDAIGEILVVFQRRVTVHAITRGDILCDRLRLATLDEVIGILGCSRIQMEDGRGVHDEDARAVGPQPQVDAVGRLVLRRRLLLIDAGRDGLDFRKVEEPLHRSLQQCLI